MGIGRIGLVEDWAIHKNSLDYISKILSQNDSLKEEDGLSGLDTELLGDVAVVSIKGVLMPTASETDKIYGMISMQKIADEIIALDSSYLVENIVLDIDSPGGSVQGSRELANVIEGTRKPIYAYTSGYMCSCAYYLAVACDGVYATETAVVGSIGVYRMHASQEDLLKSMGIKVTFISAGELKVMGNPYKDLSQKDYERLKEDVDLSYDKFVTYVAERRGVEKEKVIETEAGAFYAEDIKDTFLIDGIQSIRELL